MFVVRFSELWTEEFSFSWQKRTELVFTPGRGVGWGAEGEGTPYSGLNGEALPEEGTFLRL